MRYGHLGLHRVDDAPHLTDDSHKAAGARPDVKTGPSTDVDSVTVLLYHMSTGEEEEPDLSLSPDELSTKIRDPLKRELVSRSLFAITQPADELLQIISELAPFDVRSFSKSTRSLIEVEKRAKAAGIEDAKLRVATPCVMICDPGNRIDCEVALVQLRALRDLGHIEPLGVIANLWPSGERARLLRGTLDVLGMHNVPVGIGSNGRRRGLDTILGGAAGHLANDDRTGKAWQGAESYITPVGSERESSIVTAQQLLQMVFENAPPASITLLCTSSLKDAAIFLRDSGKPNTNETNEMKCPCAVTHLHPSLRHHSVEQRSCFSPKSAPLFLQELSILLLLRTTVHQSSKRTTQTIQVKIIDR